jgi:hypothetical protein
MKASEIIELQKYEKSGNFYPLFQKTLQGSQNADFGYLFINQNYSTIALNIKKCEKTAER